MTISLCIPAYRAERFIQTAVESCLAQTEPPHEIILSDDFSPDATRKIINRFADAPRVRIVYPERHLGIAGHYQHVVKTATGSHVTLLSSDDALHPDFVAGAKRELARSPGLGLLAFGGFHCDARMQPVEQFGLSYPRARLEQPLGFQHFLAGCRYLISFSVWDRSALLELPMLPDDAALATDWYWGLTVGACRSIRFSRKALGYYRLHENNSSHSDRERWERHALAMLKTVFNKRLLPDSLAEQLQQRLQQQPDVQSDGACSAPQTLVLVNKLKTGIKLLGARLHVKHPNYLR